VNALATSPLFRGRAPAGLVILAVFLVACGSDATTPPSGSATPPTSTAAVATPRTSSRAVPDACTIISLEEASTLLGGKNTTASPGTSGPDSSVCSFYATASDGTKLANLIIVDADSVPTSFADQASATDATAVAGIGDRAFWTPGPKGNVVLNVLSGTTSVMLGYGVLSPASSSSEQQTQLDALTTLMQAVLGRLPAPGSS
jgi:hypothetical protein